MVLSKRGQTGLFFLMMIGIIMFIIGLALAKPLVTNANQVMSNMDCNNASIDTSTKITCGVIDISSPFVVGIILALAGMTLGARLIGL